MFVGASQITIACTVFFFSPRENVLKVIHSKSELYLFKSSKAIHWSFKGVPL